MKQTVEEVIVIPIGPTCNLDYIQDTIDSIIFYTKSSYEIVIIDDSGKDTSSSLLSKCPFLKILKNEKTNGLQGGHYITLSKAYEFAFDNYEFEVLLKMDTDSLMVGIAPEKDAILHFRKYPHIGQLGSHRVDCNGDKRIYINTKNILNNETNWRTIFNNYKLYIILQKTLRQALKNGYEHGEHCLGGAYFLSKACIEKLVKNNLIQREELRHSKLEEDQIFGLLIRSIGFELGDFVIGDFPIGIRHKGLPCSPVELIKRKKKLIHSTRFWENMNEDQIREFFRKIRNGSLT